MKEANKLHPAASLAGFVLLCLGVGFLGSLSTAPAIPTWYAGLEKPFWGPPNWLFAPVWTTLYVCIAVAGWRLHRLRAKLASTLWWIQLILNAAWSPVFFGLQQPWLALGVIGAMFVAIALTIRASWNTSRLAVVLLAPYLMWVGFASALNLAIAAMN